MADRLNKTVRELDALMDSAELTDWHAFDAASEEFNKLQEPPDG